VAYIRLQGLQEACNTSIRKASVPAKSKALYLGQPVQSDDMYYHIRIQQRCSNWGKKFYPEVTSLCDEEKTNRNFTFLLQKSTNRVAKFIAEYLKELGTLIIDISLV
jgi:hypothetical protein